MKWSHPFSRSGNDVVILLVFLEFANAIQKTT